MDQVVYPLHCKAYTDSTAVLYWNTQLLCAQKPKIVQLFLDIGGANVTMYRVKGPDNVVLDYISRLPVHLLPSPAFAFTFASRIDSIQELNTVDDRTADCAGMDIQSVSKKPHHIERLGVAL